jgi:hypothetical protein
MGAGGAMAESESAWPVRHNADWELHLYERITSALCMQLHRTSIAFEARIGGHVKSEKARVANEFNLSATLGLQGLWERQFRLWLEQSAFDLKWKKSSLQKLRRANWTGSGNTLEKQLVELRGFALSDLEEGAVLRELCVVANAIKHGNGDSTARLYAGYPHVLRQVPWEPAQLSEMTDEPETLAIFVSVASSDLLRYGQAAAAFWRRLATYYDDHVERNRS